MKNMIIRMVAVILVALLLLSAAGCSQPAPEIDALAILQSLLKQVRFDTELSAVGSSASLYFPDLPDGTQIQLYSGSGYFADEVALLTLPNASDRSGAVKAVEEHIKELREQFMYYVPEEVGKIDHAVTYQNGRFVFLCITNDYANADLILNHADNPDYQLSQMETSSKQENSHEESSVPVVTVPQEEYPVLKSQSGTYHNYGTGAIRVDDTAFELYGYVDSAAEDYAAIVNRTAEALSDQTTVYDLAIPTAIGVVLPDDIAQILPGYTDQGEVIRKIFAKMSDPVVTVDCFDNIMKHRDEYLYFHTDYHWNGRGAYYAYESFCKAKGVAPIGLEDRTEKQFDGFLGALYWNNTSEDPILQRNPDTVLAYCPKSPRASMTFTDKKGDTYDWSIIMDVSGWKASTKYSTFAGADNPFSVFTNPDVTDGSVCVIVKESYGNALLPYLVDHYSTIYEIDYRYWEGNLIDFALEKGADDLIFANNLSMIGSNLLIGKLDGIVS